MPEGMSMEDLIKQFEFVGRNSDALNRAIHEVDPMALQWTLVASVEHQKLLDLSKNEKLSIVWGAFHIAPLVKERDMCFVYHTVRTTCPMTGDPLYVCNAFSTEHPAIPDMYKELGRIRGHIEATGYIFRPLPDNKERLSMTYVLQVDPKGWLPATVVNIVSVSQAMNAGRTRDGYQRCWDASKSMGTQLPLECYAMPGYAQVTHDLIVKEDFDNEPEETCSTSTKYDMQICLSAEHTASVRLQESLSSLSGNSMDSLVADFLLGKPVHFGGQNNPVLTIDLQFSLPKGSKGLPELPLEINNLSRKKNNVFLPDSASSTSSMVDGPATSLPAPPRMALKRTGCKATRIISGSYTGNFSLSLS